MHPETEAKQINHILLDMRRNFSAVALVRAFLAHAARISKLMIAAEKTFPKTIDALFDEAKADALTPLPEGEKVSTGTLAEVQAAKSKAVKH